MRRGPLFFERGIHLVIKVALCGLTTIITHLPADRGVNRDAIRQAGTLMKQEKEERRAGCADSNSPSNGAYVPCSYEDGLSPMTRAGRREI